MMLFLFNVQLRNKYEDDNDDDDDALHKCGLVRRAVSAYLSHAGIVSKPILKLF